MATSLRDKILARMEWLAHEWYREKDEGRKEILSIRWGELAFALAPQGSQFAGPILEPAEFKSSELPTLPRRYRLVRYRCGCEASGDSMAAFCPMHGERKEEA